MKLVPELFEKPWGRSILPPPFDSVAAHAGHAGAPVGEIWFEPDDGIFLPVLVKYLFTSEKLSVQVHPDDQQAHARGLRFGKNECWYIIDAEPGAMLGLGLKRTLARQELREAALDGSIADLLDWRPIHQGEFYKVPAGTIHAMSAGISLIEFQQNIDVTYRLYDHGRPRELHLDDAVDVAMAGPYPDDHVLHVNPDGAVEQPLVHFPQFDVLFSRDLYSARANRMERAMWVVPLSGEVTGGGSGARPGEVLYLAPGQAVDRSPIEGTALVGIASSDEL